MFILKITFFSVFGVQQGANRQLWFASKQSLSYLDGR